MAMYPLPRQRSARTHGRLLDRLVLAMFVASALTSIGALFGAAYAIYSFTK